MFLIKFEGLNLTTLLAEIFAWIFVFGFRPILSFLLTTSRVPKEEILILLDLIRPETKDSKKLSTISEEIFLEKPNF